MPRWLRNSLVAAAVAGAAVLLWVGFALLVAALMIAVIPFAVWSNIRRRRRPEGPVTVEGSATRVNEKVVLEPPPPGRPEARPDPKDY